MHRPNRAVPAALLTALACAAVAPVANAGSALPACGGSPFTESCEYTVPAGMTIAKFVVKGGGGGAASQGPGYGYTPSPRGGHGAVVTAYQRVIPGSKIRVIVGQGGFAFSNCTCTQGGAASAVAAAGFSIVAGGGGGGGVSVHGGDGAEAGTAAGGNGGSDSNAGIGGNKNGDGAGGRGGEVDGKDNGGAGGIGSAAGADAPEAAGGGGGGHGGGNGGTGGTYLGGWLPGLAAEWLNNNFRSGGGGAGFGGGGGSLFGGGGGYGGGGGSSNLYFQGAGGAGGSYAPESAAGYPAPTFAAGSNGFPGLGSNTGGGNGSVAITAEAPIVEPISSPSVLTPAPGTATLYKTKVAGVSKWAIKVGLLFSTGGDNRPAARLLTVQVYADRDGRPLSARPSDGQGSPGSASYTNGVIKWSVTGDVTRQSVAPPVWVRVGNRTGKWSNWVQLSR